MPHPPEGEHPHRGTNYRQLLSLVLACGCIVWLIEYPIQPVFAAANNNLLLTGRRALLDCACEVPIVSPLEFDGLTKKQIMRLRTEAVWQQPLLIANGYTPSNAVYGGIQDGAPWWGTVGQFYHGRGLGSIDGPSEEARQVFNPFLLVDVELIGLSIWNNDFVWDKSRITEDVLASPGFPLYCRPRTLTWHPKESRADVVYDLSDYIGRVNSYLVREVSVSDATFTLVANNARDMNLNYYFIPPRDLLRIDRFDETDQPDEIEHTLHRGENCGYPGGCNNGSPRETGLEGYAIEGLPAKIVIKLWRDQPVSVSQPEEMRFTIRFE